MRHAHRKNRLARRSEHYEATMDAMAFNVLQHGRIKTTIGKAKHAQRVVEKLITLGKDGSVSSRRRAFRVLQNRDMVKRLFAEVAPLYNDCRGGYTRVIRLSAYRPGDGAEQALLELTRRPVTEEPKAPPAKKAKAKAPEPVESAAGAKEEPSEKPKKFLEGIRGLFKKKGAES